MLAFKNSDLAFNKLITTNMGSNNTPQPDETTQVIMKLIELTQKAKIKWQAFDVEWTTLGITDLDKVHASFRGPYKSRVYVLTRLARKLGKINTWTTPLSSMLGHPTELTRVHYVLSVYDDKEHLLRTINDVPVLSDLKVAISNQLASSVELLEELSEE